MLIAISAFFPKEIVDNSAKKLVNLAAKWEKVRGPLIEEFRTLRELSSQREVFLFFFLFILTALNLMSFVV
jgi:hypothetical protein